MRLPYAFSLPRGGTTPSEENAAARTVIPPYRLGGWGDWPRTPAYTEIRRCSSPLYKMV